MNIEIRKVQNGYLVRPFPYDHRGDRVPDDRCWVFENYAKLTDKLQEILEQQELK